MTASKKHISTFVRSNAIKNRRKAISTKNKQRKNENRDPKKNDETNPIRPDQRVAGSNLVWTWQQRVRRRTRPAQQRRTVGV